MQKSSLLNLKIPTNVNIKKLKKAKRELKHNKKEQSEYILGHISKSETWKKIDNHDQHGRQ